MTKTVIMATADRQAFAALTKFVPCK